MVLPELLCVRSLFAACFRFRRVRLAPQVLIVMPMEISVSEIKLDVSDEQAAKLKVLNALLDAAGVALANAGGVGPLRAVVRLLVGQMFASGRALQLVCIGGRANQAPPIARAMVEHAINVCYIAQDPETRSRRFWAYRDVVLRDLAQARQRAIAPTEQVDPVTLERAAAAERELGPTARWDQGVGIRHRARECGLEDLYHSYYAEGSTFVHGDGTMLDALRDRNAPLVDDRVFVHLGPSASGIENVVAPAITATFAALFTFCRVFEDFTLDRELARIATMLPPNTKRLDVREHFSVIQQRLDEIKRRTD